MTAPRSLSHCKFSGLLLASFTSLSPLNRWSRRWLPARSSKTRRTTTHRACPSCLSAPDSVSHCSLCSQRATNAFRSVKRVCSYSDGENINPKVVQALGSEKMKVSEALDSFNYKLSISMYWSSCAFVPSMQCRSPSTTGGATSPAPGSCCSLPTVPLLQRRASSSSALTTALWKVRGQKQTDASRVFLSFSGCLSHDLE